MATPDDITLALRAAPEAYQDPSIAITAASMGGDVKANAEVAAHSLNTQAVARGVNKAADRSGGKGVLGASLSWLGGGVKGAMDLAGDALMATANLANKPLAQIQQQYRYLRDVQDRHGFGEMLLSAAPMAIGGTIGGFVAGPGGIAVGASLFGKAQEEFIPIYGDSWKRVEKGEEYRDAAGQLVSPGRDAARFLGSLSKHVGIHIEQHKGFDLYDAVSAMGDGVFSIAADPLAGAASVRKGALGAKGARGALAARYSGTALTTGTDLAKVTAQYPSVMKGLETLAKLDASTIAARYPKLSPFANQLGDADTWEKAGQVLKDNADAAAMRLRTLPRQTLAKETFGDLVRGYHEKAQGAALTQQAPEAGALGRGLLGAKRRGGEVYKRFTTMAPTSMDPVSNKLQRKFLYLNDPRSTRTIYDLALWGHNPEMARAVAQDWAQATLPDRQVIYRNLVADNIGNRMEALQPGWTKTPEGQKHLTRLADEVDIQFGGIDNGRVEAWAYDAEGRIASKMPSQGQTVSAPIYEFQHPKIALPDYVEYDRSLKALGNGSELYGQVDDLLYKHFTQRVFMRWALVSGGFAIRNSSSDLIAGFAKNPLDVTRAKIAQLAKNRGWSLAEGEDESLLAVAARYVAHKADVTDEDLDDLVALQKLNNGHVESASIRAGHESGVEIVGMEQYVKDETYSLRTQVAKSVRVTDEFQAWAPDHDDHWQQWHKQAKDIAEGSPAARAAAAEFAAVLDEGLGVAEATNRATLAAKKVLDETPEEVLDQHKRHFYGSTVDEQIPGAVGSDLRRWVPGTLGRPAHWETVATPPIGQVTAQRPLVNPAGNVPAGLREPGSIIEETGAPFGSTFEQRRMVSPEQPAIPASTEQVQGHLFGPQLLTQPRILPVTDPHFEWAQTIVEGLKGTVTGADNTIHNDLLRAISEGATIDPKVLKEIPVGSRPNKIIGAYEKPPAPGRLNGYLFGKINTFMNWAAREPLMIDAFQREMKDTFRPLVKSGVLTHDEAVMRANIRATEQVLPYIDNAAERSLMAEHARNWIPFYGAQQQAYSRAFRLLAEDPLAFRRVQLSFTQMANFGGIYDDEQGNSHFVLPGAGWLTGGAITALNGLGLNVVGSVPTAFSGNLRSLASVSPFLEGGEFIKPGPLVGIATRLINNILPETRAITDPIVGEIAANQPMWEMIVPNATARNILKSTIVSDNRTMAKSVLDAIQSLEYQQNIAMKEWDEGGRKGVPPTIVPGADATDMQRQDFINKVKNQARILGIFKAAFGAVSPVAPSVQLGDLDLKDELQTLIAEKGVTNAVQEFLLKNPDATPYAVFKTTSGTPSPIDSTHPAQEWVRDNLGFIKDERYAQAASYFVPQTDDKFSLDVYNEQMAMGFRRTKAPDKLIEDIHISEGNRWYFDKYKPALDAALAKAPSPHMREQIRFQFRTQGDPKQDIAALETMKMQNPLWYGNFSSGVRDAERQVALSQMRNAITSGDLPKSPMTEKITALIKQVDQHQLRMLPGRTDQYASMQRKQERERWQNQLKLISEAHPELTMVVNNVFKGA